MACLLAVMGLVYPQAAKTVKAEPIVSEEVVYIEATPAILAQSEVLLASWQKAKEVKKTPPKPKFKPTGACSCVLWVKAQVPFTRSVGNARNWPVTSKVPSVGAVVVTYESRPGHVALVTGIEGDFLILSEANYSRCRVTHGRRLNIHSSLIKGFWTN